MDNIEELEKTKAREEKLLQSVETQANGLRTDRLDISFGEIINMYERNELAISPAFQRLFRWSDEQKTRFIESLLLGIPIPPIFVAEDKEGVWELVDGLQRVSTILSFFGVLKVAEEPDGKNNFMLEQGSLVEELEGLSCDALPNRLKLSIKRAVCRVEILKRSVAKQKYELFNRLNTGGTPLTEQEIRNCVFRSGTNDNFHKALEEMSRHEAFVKLVKPTENQKKTLYDQELVLRFLSLYDEGENVKHFLSVHMDDYMAQAVNNLPEETFKIFSDTLNFLDPLGDRIFRSQNGGFSASIYDAVMIGVSKNIQGLKKLSQEQLKEKIDSLKTAEGFRKTIGSLSSSQSRVKKRVEFAINFFNRC